MPTLALSRSLAARARARIAELDQEIERLQRTDEAIVVATGVRRANAWHGSCGVVPCDAQVAICGARTAI
jgi:hypothetical protein